MNENTHTNSKWKNIYKISNIILTIIYTLFGWFFSFLGIMFFSLGLPNETLSAICSFLSSLMLLLTPAFCMFGIVFSVILRKKENYIASFIIQFVPFATLAIALVTFFLAII